MEKNTSTMFTVYLLEKTKPGKQEAVLRLMSHKGRKIPNRKSVHFDFLDEFPRMVRKELKAANIAWPPPLPN